VGRCKSPLAEFLLTVSDSHIQIPVSSGTLEWVPCYIKADCARLEVPMDYDDPEGVKVILAVVRHKATDTENYKGPVIFNSGVSVVIFAVEESAI
jgi:hypothetical protein